MKYNFNQLRKLYCPNIKKERGEKKETMVISNTKHDIEENLIVSGFNKCEFNSKI